MTGGHASRAGCESEPSVRILTTPRTHLNLLLKLLDLPFQRLHVGDEGDRVRGAGGVHRVLLQLLARLRESTALSWSRDQPADPCADRPVPSPWRSASGILSCWSQASAQTCSEPPYARSRTSSSPWTAPAVSEHKTERPPQRRAADPVHFSQTQRPPSERPAPFNKPAGLTLP